MKILLINGSPRVEKSNTLNISRAFISGFSDCETEEIALSKLSVAPCKGCFSCWGRTAGSCVIKDDMDMLRLKILLSDIIVESFPLYFFGMPSQMKAMTDRCLPMMLPYGGGVGANGGKPLFHELRDEEMEKKRLVVISSCGYAETEVMYPALIKQLDLICGEGRYTSIFCAQGELFFSGTAERQRKAYLELIRQAGREFCENGDISGELMKKINKPLLSQKGFETVTRNHREWFAP
ncbi:MAG: flavodoxin family protein [Bacteroides sp.]|nr:flavodoxin family protein [Bacteroides sp.]